jgi:hypothetical protein
MLKYLIISAVIVIAFALLLTYAFLTSKWFKRNNEKINGKRRSLLRYRFGHQDKESQPDLDWDSFDNLAEYTQPKIFESRCVSVQPRTYEDLHKVGNYSYSLWLLIPWRLGTNP